MHYLKADQVVSGAYLKPCQPNFSLSSLPPASTILLGVVKDTAFANKCCFPDNKGVMLHLWKLVLQCSKLLCFLKPMPGSWKISSDSRPADKCLYNVDQVFMFWREEIEMLLTNLAICSKFNFKNNYKAQRFSRTILLSCQIPLLLYSVSYPCGKRDANTFVLSELVIMFKMILIKWKIKVGLLMCFELQV